MQYNLFISLVLAASSLGDQINYSNQKVIRISLDGSATNKVNATRLNLAIEKLGLDVWSRSLQAIELRVKDEEMSQLKMEMGSESIKEDILVENLQSLIDESNSPISTMSNGQSYNENQNKTLSNEYFTKYHPYGEILGWYKSLTSKYPGHVEYKQSIGKSHEGRDIAAVHITNKNVRRQKKKVWFQSLIHAREWITGSTVAYVVNHLLETNSKYLDQIELIVIPVVNPDGYEYTWRTDRMWRKNRGHKFGVDLNRNWPYHWGGPGSSTNPRSETYSGPSAASEPEVQAIIAYFDQFRGKTVGAIDFHSYSQLILRPYGWSASAKAINEPALVKLGAGMANQISTIRNTRYQNIRAVDLYPASGITSDWFYGDGNNGPNYAYTIELSPSSNGGYGFVLPPSEIIPVGNELVRAMDLFLKECSI